MSIDGHDITVSLDSTIVLKNISFSLKPCHLTVFLGKSGSGKTTLLRCLAGLQKISSGYVTKEEKKRIGFVSQSLDLFPHMSILKNCIHPQICVLKRKRNEAEKIARGFLEKLELLDHLYKMPCQLSGGQKQRLAIARILSMNVDTILFDEPTSALDPYSTENFRLLLESLKKEGLILVASTHDMNFVKSSLDRVYLICDGSILDFYEKSSGKEIDLNSPLYEYIWNNLGNKRDMKEK